MTARPRRSARALVVCGVFVAAQALLVSSSVSAPTDSSCTALREWARAYQGSSPTLEDLARFDRPHRRAIFNAVAPAVRATLWQDQLRRFDRQADLSAAQHALIGEALTLTTPALYERDEAATRAMLQFQARAIEAFPSQVQKRAWTDLGSTVALPQPASASAWDRLVRSLNVNAAAVAECNCALGQNSECSRCAATGCSLGEGCGWTGMMQCNGTCL